MSIHVRSSISMQLVYDNCILPAYLKSNNLIFLAVLTIFKLFADNHYVIASNTDKDEITHSVEKLVISYLQSKPTVHSQIECEVTEQPLSIHLNEDLWSAIQFWEDPPFG